MDEVDQSQAIEDQLKAPPVERDRMLTCDAKHSVNIQPVDTLPLELHPNKITRETTGERVQCIPYPNNSPGYNRQ